ncbi:MAG: DUF1573 domain-containing protein [Planctomycetia bacterium]|nr:DUF1573 domain-containing protein [Planctomycetia bacterium]
MFHMFCESERREMFAKRFILTLLLMVWTVTASAQSLPTTESWAVRLFSEVGTVRTHDFGSVALHAKVEHRFLFKNIYREDVVVQSAASNCGCTKVSVTKTLLHPGETAEIVARVDTSGKEHTKRRKATITVRFSKPSLAEVQLQITTYIRPDIGFEPGMVEFGTVAKGKTLSKKVYLQYEGQSNWGLTAIRKSSSAIKAEAKEVTRQNGRIVYEITVSLNENAPSGYLNDLLRFTTNEVNANQTSVFLPIHGLVMEPLIAKPSFFQLGIVHPGETVTKNLVVRGSKPFRISSIKADDSRMSFLVARNESVVHVIPVTFVADQRTGEISQSINIVTNQTDLDPVSVHVTGFVNRVEEVAQATDGPAPNAAPAVTNPDPDPATTLDRTLLDLELPQELSHTSQTPDATEQHTGDEHAATAETAIDGTDELLLPDDNSRESNELSQSASRADREVTPKPLLIEDPVPAPQKRPSDGWRTVPSGVDAALPSVRTDSVEGDHDGEYTVRRPNGPETTKKEIQFRAPTRAR